MLEAQEAQSTAIATLTASIADLDRRLTRLETREELVVSEAKNAARAASHEATQGSLADLARRIGHLEAAAPPRRPPKTMLPRN